MLAKSTSEKFATHAEVQFRTYNGKVGKRLKSECNAVLIKQGLTPPTIHQKQTATTAYCYIHPLKMYITDNII